MITLTDYDPDWPGRFEAEAAEIRRLFGAAALQVEHVGSTAVPGLAAKPVIDIQISVASLADRAFFDAALGSLGYAHIDLGAFDRVYPFYAKPPQWPSTHHVHLCVAGSREERVHLAFRDSLAKSDFVRGVLDRALQAGHPQSANLRPDHA